MVAGLGQEDIVEGRGADQLLAELGISEEPGDPSQGLEVLAPRVFRNHQQEEEMRGLPVDRLEVNALHASREGGDDAVEARNLPVRNCDPFADSSALERLTVRKHFLEPLRVQRRLGFGHRPGEFLEDRILGVRGQVEDRPILDEDVLDLQADSPGGRVGDRV